MPHLHCTMNSDLASRLKLTPVLPVVVIDDAASAIPLAEALLAGGIDAIEITLRTPAALDAIRAVSNQIPKMTVAAGTVLSAEDLQRAQDAGAQFAVSPGATPALLSAAQDSRIPLLPGVATASDIMLGLEFGLEFFKFFPAATSGGIEMLKAFAGPFASLRFCPTGGINLQNASAYLALENVVCVGGSWVTPASLIEHKDWKGIERLAKQAAAALRQ